MQNGTTALENSSALSYELNITLRYQPATAASAYNPLKPRKPAPAWLGQFSSHHPKLEAVKISFSQWVDKFHSVEYYSATRRNELSSHENTRSLTCISTSERSQSERVAHCLIPTVWHSGKGKTMVTKWVSGCQVLGGRGGLTFGVQARSVRSCNHGHRTWCTGQNP